MAAIHDAIQAHDLDKLKKVLMGDPSQVALCNSLEETPLHRAVWEGQLEMAALLIEVGADVNAVELNDENTPLHYAAHEDPPAALAELLIRKGADIEKRNSAGETPLIVAAMRNPDVAEVLIGAGARYDLNSAIFLGDIDRARASLKEDPKLQRVRFPDLLLDSALRRGSKDIVELLLTHGVDPNRGAPPVFTAVTRTLNNPTGDMKVLRLLLQHGADVNRRSQGMSVVDFVRKFHSKNTRKVLALLKKHGAEE